jgi:coproporphyrinogen III oxidase-like Fe-S oxidoreductase
MSYFCERLEAGPWLQAGRKLGGEEVAATLAESFATGAGAKPYCIYVHVPFCSSRCTFCALYTNIITDNGEQVADAFTDVLARSIENHPQRHSRRPPTTVHYGGGTPMFLGAQRLNRINDAIRGVFGDSPSCEWALETTTSSVIDDSISTWQDGGFSRIHLGVQTLNDDLRRRIGRHEDAATVLEKIGKLLDAGFMVSVDLIIGLAGSDEAIVARDLEQLHDAGIRMYSVCELRHLRSTETRRQKRVAESERNFGYWEIIWDFMDRHELIPIHLGQFARRSEDNLYFTHPARGESCVAIGPYSHGSDDNIYYSNKLLPEFQAAVRDQTTPIESGVAYQPGEQIIRRLESELLTHSVRRESVAAMEECFGRSFRWLWNYLGEDALIEEAVESYRLTRSGSWYLGNIIREMRALSDA